MKASESPATSLRDLPSIDELVRNDALAGLVRECGAGYAAGLARKVVDDLRNEIASGTAEPLASTGDRLADEAIARIKHVWRSSERNKIRRVINATGVIIHTNLGRAPLSIAARKAIANEAAGYCTVEYDLDTGERGRRGATVEQMVAEITGAESAAIVNNCAAAAFLVLKVFASGGEVIISRGELVEIGGDFRVPDVLVQSGATLREVGTTNRTKIDDYEKALTEYSRMILRVHPSNYRIVGFTESPGISAIADVAHRNGLILYEDIGSGALIDLSRFGLRDEPMVGRSIAAGADIVTFSGDKLVGGPQAGIIAGRRELIDKVRKHPLYRALRADKLVYAGLEATLAAYRCGTALDEIPVLKMLSTSVQELWPRAEGFAARIANANVTGLTAETIVGASVVGGGAAPDVHPDSVLIALRHERHSPDALASLLRRTLPPVIARIEDGRVLLDLRTVFESDEDELLAAIESLG